ncbi:DUF5343 domain-containing protein [Ruegeria sp. HKCCA5463]|uniref:DUF5343 domain-containing protein n=1 Tax=Ruegeria sp. HKCCA5463 TaxID=2682994 RepID=UPI001C2BB3AA
MSYKHVSFEEKMALLNQSMQVYGKFGEFFGKLREGQAPEKFSREFLKDLGFKSSNWHAAIGLLKGLGFLSSDGAPTKKYMEFLDPTRWQIVLAEAVKEAYSDIFVMKREPTSNDVQMIAGKYKSTYNMSDTASDRAARTFLALLDLCDKDTLLGQTQPDVVGSSELEDHPVPETAPSPVPASVQHSSSPAQHATPPAPIGLNYNIQIHLPATKDIEVYNAIFKSLREHIIE